MSAAREPQRGDTRPQSETPQWSTWNAEGGVSADGKRYRIEWWPAGKIKHALFRVATDDRVAIIQHVRTIYVRQAGAASRCELDESATVDDVPATLRAKMQADGYRPANSGEVVPA